MNYLIALTLSFLCLANAKDLDIFEKEAERKIYEIVQSVSQRQDRVLVSVTAYPKVEKEEKSKKKKEKIEDLGYLPFPVKKQDVDSSAATTDLSSWRSLIDRIEINLFLDSSISKNDEIFIESAIKTAFSHFKPKIFTKNFPQKTIQETVKEQKSSWLRLVESNFFVTTLFLLIVGSLWFLVGLYSLFRLSNRIINGLKEVRRIGISTFNQNAGSENTEKSSSNDLGLVQPTQSENNFLPTINEVETMLSQNPMAITLLAFEVDDLGGVKYLLAKLTPETRATVVSGLSKDLVSRMEKAAIPANFGQWLRSFSARLAISSVKATNGLKQLLSPNELSSITSTSPEQWKNILGKIPENAQGDMLFGLLLVLDSSAQISLLNSLSDNLLEKLIASPSVALPQIKAYFDKVLPHLSSSDPLSESSNLKSQTFLVFREWLKESPISREESLLTLASKRGISNFSEELRKCYWSKLVLASIPQPTLEAAFRPLTLDQKELLLLDMNEGERQLFISLMPEGNAKTVLIDKLAKRTPNSRDLKEARITQFQFFESLRKKHENQEFELLMSKKSEPLAA